MISLSRSEYNAMLNLTRMGQRGFLRNMLPDFNKMAHLIPLYEKRGGTRCLRRTHVQYGAARRFRPRPSHPVQNILKFGDAVTLQHLTEETFQSIPVMKQGI